VSRLVQSIAPLCRQLRSAALEQLAAEKRVIKTGANPTSQPFTGLAKDWRRLLFPQLMTPHSPMATSTPSPSPYCWPPLFTDNAADRFAVTLDLLLFGRVFSRIRVSHETLLVPEPYAL
jgi:hypothetical protein